MVRKTSQKVFNRLSAASGGTVLRACFLVSLLLHAATLLGMQQAFPLNWLTGPVQTYEVELLRPPVDPTLDRNEAGADITGPGAGEDTQDREMEDTISLNTKDRRYSSYAKVIKDRLARQWEYPEIARINLMEGETRVLFSLNRQGELVGIRLIESSQAGILDTETFRTIRAAAPFPPFPPSIAVSKLNIKANFAYRLTARR